MILSHKKDIMAMDRMDFPECCSAYSLIKIYVVWDTFPPWESLNIIELVHGVVFGSQYILPLFVKWFRFSLSELLWCSMHFDTHPRWWCAYAGLKVIGKCSIFKERVGSFLIFHELLAGSLFINSHSFKASKHFQTYYPGNSLCVAFSISADHM